MNSVTTNQTSEVSDEEIRELVKARLRASERNGIRISVGSSGDFSISELIAQIDEHTALGDKIVQIQLAYLKALKTGILLNDLDV